MSISLEIVHKKIHRKCKKKKIISYELIVLEKKII